MPCIIAFPRPRALSKEGKEKREENQLHPPPLGFRECIIADFNEERGRGHSIFFLILIHQLKISNIL
jgi:hypothetical protein